MIGTNRSIFITERIIRKLEVEGTPVTEENIEKAYNEWKENKKYVNAGKFGE